MLKQCSEERYYEALNILPPRRWIDKGFLVGEPHSHGMCPISKVVRATYAAFFRYQGKFYEHEPMTVPQFNAYDVPKNLPA